MKRKACIFVVCILMIGLLTSCLNTKMTKAHVPKHDKLDSWEITCEDYAKKLKDIVTNYYGSVALEFVSSTDTKLGNMSEYNINGDPDSGYDFTIKIMEGKDGFIDQIATISFKDIEIEVEDEIDIYIGYTRICLEALIMALDEVEISEEVENKAQKLFDDNYLLDHNIKYETIFNSFSSNGYIKQIDR